MIDKDNYKIWIVLLFVLILVGTACSGTSTEIEIDRNGDTCAVVVHQNIPGGRDDDIGPLYIPCEITEANDSDGHN